MVEMPVFTGRELAAWRKKRQLTQTAFAALIGKNLRTVQAWEALPDLPLIVKFALAYLSMRLNQK